MTASRPGHARSDIFWGLLILPIIFGASLSRMSLSWEDILAPCAITGWALLYLIYNRTVDPITHYSRRSSAAHLMCFGVVGLIALCFSWRFQQTLSGNFQGWWPLSAEVIFAGAIVVLGWILYPNLLDNSPAAPCRPQWLTTYRVVMVCVAVTALQLVPLTCSRDLWADECYSLRLVEASSSLQELIQWTRLDAHPPLYYIMLYGAMHLNDALGAPAAPEYVGRALSLLPLFIGLGLTVTYGRRLLGHTAAAFGAIALLSSPVVEFGLEIRMYSWAALWVLGAFLAVCAIVRRGPSIVRVFLLILCSLLAAYTNHYAFVATGAIIAGWLIFILRGERRRIYWWLITVCVITALYLPLLASTLHQLKAVSAADFWIEPVTWVTLAQWLRILFQTPLLFLLVSFVAIRCASLLRRGSATLEYPDIFAGLTGIAPIAAIIIVGILLSWLYSPMIFWRYFIPAVPVMWIGIALTADAIHAPKLRLWLTVVLTVQMLFGTYGFISSEREQSRQATFDLEVMQSCADATFLTDHILINHLLKYRCGPDRAYLIGDRVPENIEALFGDTASTSILNPGQLRDLVADRDSVIFLTVDPSRADTTRLHPEVASRPMPLSPFLHGYILTLKGANQGE